MAAGYPTALRRSPFIGEVLTPGRMSDSDNIDWSVLLSASVISLVPMVVLFAIFQRQIMNADVNSGLKD